MTSQQMTLDWTRRERSADRTDDVLRELGIPELQRALIWLLITHDDARCLDTLSKVVTLSISYARAGRYLRQQADRFDHLVCEKGSLRRAAQAWADRGLLLARAGQVTTLVCNFQALAEWAQGEDERRQNLIAEWAAEARPLSTVADRCSPLSAVALSMNEGKKTLSFLHSEGAAPLVSPESRVQSPELPAAEPLDTQHSTLNSAGPLPALPDAVFGELEGQKLYQAVREWWRAEGLTDRGFHPDHVLGAIMAAIAGKVHDPQKYVAACLRGGVGDVWVRKASAFRKRHSQTEQTYAPMGVVH